MKNQIEPLQRFAEAKKSMGKIYSDLSLYIDELANFYRAIEKDQQKFVPLDKITEVEHFRESIKAIREMFSRDKMKVVFFGRTSNGKSSVINAMLHSKVLPQGMGHTTCCFLQVEGTSENEKYYICEGSDKKIPLTELENAGHALSAENLNLSSMGKDSLIKIFFPKPLSKLLQNEVVIVDSPGIDVSKEFDSWIDKHCLDADVFVLVCNSESTLTQAEKDFFHRVSKKISRPNIFILNNRWENSNSESEQRREQLRNQHQTRFIEFLSKELKVCNATAAKERFYFISAREMLDARLKLKNEISHPYQQEGFQRRQLEFQNFETNFEKCISKSAICTKFEGHSNTALEIIEKMRYNVESVFNSANQRSRDMKLDLSLRTENFQQCQKKFEEFQKVFFFELKKLRSEVNMRVSSDFHDEIMRLESILDCFKCEFNDTPHQIQNYKTNLANYVNSVVTTDLQNRCTGGLIGSIWKIQEFMLSSIKEVMGDEHLKDLERVFRQQQPFTFTINVNCPALVQDFHEDLEFRFSLGIESIARQILSITRGQPVTSIGENVVKINGQNQYQTNQNDVDTFITRVLIQSATYLANGSVGIALVGLIIYKNVDWKWIAGGAGVVSAMYAFERYKWNTGAKEERLKDQFCSHLEQRLRQVEHMHTAQCESQVVNDLTKTFGGLKLTVSDIFKNMNEKINNSKKSVERMEEFVKGLSALKGKTNYVSSSLEAFATKFLTSDLPA